MIIKTFCVKFAMANDSQTGALPAWITIVRYAIGVERKKELNDMVP